MTDRDALLRSIIENPSEDTPRLIFADFIEEQGEADRAEFIRVGVEFARLGETRCKTCSGRGWYSINDMTSDECIYCDTGRLLRRMRELWKPPLNRQWVKDLDIGMLVIEPRSSPRPHSIGIVRRGFMGEFLGTWAEWLRLEEKLYWRPGLTDRCPKCHGEGCPDHGPNDVLRQLRKCCETCRGANRIPRPFPGATVQPLTAVRLTDWPPQPANGDDVFGTSEGYRFDRMKCPKCDGLPVVATSGNWYAAEWHPCPQCHGQPLNSWTCERWPGVVFVMPERQVWVDEAAEIPQGGWELDIIHERFDSTDYYAHPPTLIRGDLAWRGPAIFGVQAQLGRTFIAQAMTRGGEVYTVQAALTHCEHEIFGSDRVPMMRLRARTTGPIGGNR